MRLSGTAKSIFVWVAACALLLAAAMSTLMRAMPLSGGVQFVCSAASPQRVAAGENATQSDPRPASPTQNLDDHCPWCALGTVVLGLPPAPLLVVPGLALRRALPLLFFGAPRTLHAWTSAQPRAPPRIS